MAISRSDALHLLRRSGFAATPQRITELAASADWTAAVDSVMDTSAAPFPPLPAAVHDPNLNDWYKWVAVVGWWTEVMRTSPCPIVDKMALFFHGYHFVSGRAKNQDAETAWNQIRLFRQHALGDYHQLAQAVSIDPFMLSYLDNGVNRYPSKVNENFGREILEAFTIGRGNFTEADVVAMSRAWTGHNLTQDKKSYVFDPSAHDDGQKTLFGITKNWNGPDALTEVLKGVKAVPASRFLVSKLWLYFVGTNPTPAVVDSLAAEFRSSGLSLRTLVRSIFLRPEFRSAEARTALVRSPVEWFVALIGALGIKATDAHPEWFLGSMGQAPLDPPNVFGWGRNADWLASGYWWRREDCAAYLRWVATDSDWPYQRFANITSKASPRTVADTMFEAFGIVDPSAATRKTIEDYAASVTGGWHGWSMRTNAIVLTALCPEFVVG
ncbi:MAG: DUF1800 family protein [Acidimicrobiales bacterium]|nr:DUF1800 family protein [Acidimicrobiales bacterium]